MRRQATLTLSTRPLLLILASALLLALLTWGARPASADGPTTAELEVAACEQVEGVGVEAGCSLKLQQNAINTGSAVGMTTHLSQTLVAPTSGRVCQVQVYLRKTATDFGPVALRVETLGGAVLDGAVIPGGAIPVGGGWRTFNFGCDGGVLVAGQAYRLTLTAPQSPLVRYYWMRSSANPYPLGGAFSRVHPLPWGALAGDFTFRLYMCS